MEIKIAVVQPETYMGDQEWVINLKQAKKYVKESSEMGANIVCFPESFPGPWKQNKFFSPVEEMCNIAYENKIYVIFGTLEPVDNDEKKMFYNTEVIVDPQGKVLGRYRRTTPYGPWIYKGGRFWDFNYQVGHELPVFETEHCKIGILICSEVFVPELSRILALKGAEIIFIPNGVARTEMWEIWTTLIKARAFENNAICATCGNILGVVGGMAIIAGPEETLVESREKGVHLANIDLDRVRWLRANRDEYHKVLPYKSKPGLLAQWRRPDLYAELVN